MERIIVCLALIYHPKPCSMSVTVELGAIICDPKPHFDRFVREDLGALFLQLPNDAQNKLGVY